MFAIEIDFSDNSTKEWSRYFVHRPWAVIGGHEECNIVVDDFTDLDFSLLVYKVGGQSFRVKKVFINQSPVNDDFDQVFDFQTKVNISGLKIRVTNIDCDLFVQPDEPPDQAGLRLMRRALTKSVPRFPALRYSKPCPAEISFHPDQILTVGRGRGHIVRFDAKDVSTDHAKIGYDEGRFWVEDLGSTNGTFVQGRQISGRVAFPPEVPLKLGLSSTLHGLVAKADNDQARVELSREPAMMDPVTNARTMMEPAAMTEPGMIAPVMKEAAMVEEELYDKGLDVEMAEYPIIVSTSGVARPARLVLKENKWVFIGRDPESDFWLGAPYVSRQHCKLRLLSDGGVEIVDLSRNGTAYSGGIIHGDESVIIRDKPEVLHFGSGLAVAVCFAKSGEEQFFESGGRGDAFLRTEAIEVPGSIAKESKSRVEDFVASKGAGGKFGETFKPLFSSNSKGNAKLDSILGNVTANNRPLRLIAFVLFIALVIFVLAIAWAIIT